MFSFASISDMSNFTSSHPKIEKRRRTRKSRLTFFAIYEMRFFSTHPNPQLSNGTRVARFMGVHFDINFVSKKLGDQSVYQRKIAVKGSRRFWIDIKRPSVCRKMLINHLHVGRGRRCAI